jgi:hypothetical protein
MSRRVRRNALAAWLVIGPAIGLAALCVASSALAQAQEAGSDEGAAAEEAASAEEGAPAEQATPAEEAAPAEKAPAAESAEAAEPAASGEAAAEEGEENAFVTYAKSVGNRYLVGLNSLITWPADPVMDTIEPREEFNKLPLSAGTKYVAGFGQGVLLSIYRLGMGACDVAFAPLTPMKMLSPEPRYMIFPGAHHEEY